MTTTTPGARNTDPDTSHLAAERSPEDDFRQRERLLVEWFRAGRDGLTDPEAAERAGLLHRTYWKRAGEMREPSRAAPGWAVETGGIALLQFHPDGISRVWAPTNGKRKVSVITEAGRAYVLARGLVDRDVTATGVAEVLALPVGTALVHDDDPTSAFLVLGNGSLATVNRDGLPVRRAVDPGTTYRVLWSPARD